MPFSHIILEEALISVSSHKAEHAFSMFSILSELSFVNIALRVFHPPDPISQIIMEVSLVHISIIHL